MKLTTSSYCTDRHHILNCPLNTCGDLRGFDKSKQYGITSAKEGKLDKLQKVNEKENS